MTGVSGRNLADIAPAKNRAPAAAGTGRLRNGNSPGDLRLARSCRARWVHGGRSRGFAELRHDAMALHRRIGMLCDEIAARITLDAGRLNSNVATLSPTRERVARTSAPGEGEARPRVKKGLFTACALAFHHKPPHPNPLPRGERGG